MGTIHAEGDGQFSVTTETTSRRGSSSGGGGILFALLKLAFAGIRVIVKKSSDAIKKSKQEKANTQE